MRNYFSIENPIELVYVVVMDKVCGFGSWAHDKRVDLGC
jgi:hypothetical protein